MQLARQGVEPPPRDVIPRSRLFLDGFQGVYDPEVARGSEANPSEHKALKLSRAVGKTEVNKCARCPW